MAAAFHEHFRRAHAPLAIPDFRSYLIGALACTLGGEVQGATLFWQIFQLTHDPLSCGLIGLAEAVPALLLSLYAGHLTDRMDRRRLLLMAMTLMLVCSALLVMCAGLPQRPQLQWALYGISILSGVARSFFSTARSALAAELVPSALQAQAVSLRSASWQAGVIIGPGIGGVLIAANHGGCRLAYAVDALLTLLGIIATALIRHRAAARTTPQAEPFVRSVRAGLSFVWHDRTILAAMSLDLFAVLFGGAVALLPAFAASVLMVGPGRYGLLRSGQSIGALAMWLLLALMPPIARAGPIMLWSVVGFGLCWMGIAYSSWFWLTMALLLVAGALDYISVVVRLVLVQTRTPRAMMGRVSAVNSIFITSSNEIGGFESGVAARLLGLQPSVLLGGAITLLVVSLTAWWCPQLRRLGRIDALEPAGEPPVTPQPPAAAVPAETPPAAPR